MRARNHVFRVVYLCVCVILSSAPWLTSVSYLMDGWWLHHLFCLQAGNGFDWPSRQHSGSVALSVCISSRKLSWWKRLITGLKSGVMIVYWTHFPSGFPSFFLSFTVSFCTVFFILSPPIPLSFSRSLLESDPALMKFTFNHSWQCYSPSSSVYLLSMFS